MGIVMTTILGIVGSVVAGFLGRQLGWYHDGEPAGWIASVVGAIIVLFRGRPHRQETRLTQRPARPVPARRKTGRPLRGSARCFCCLAASRPKGPADRHRADQPPAACAGCAAPAAEAVRSVQPPPSALYRFTRLDRRARRVSTRDCWALYSERCESSTLR